MSAGTVSRRARDPGSAVWDFREPIWVVCPRCGRPARSTRDDAGGRHLLVCKSCAHTAAATPLVEWAGDGTDGRFGLRLYLTAKVGPETLWAYNRSHVEAMADWLGASLRERPHDSTRVNTTMMSRLPRWMKSSSNRPKVMKALAELHSRALKEDLT